MALDLNGSTGGSGDRGEPVKFTQFEIDQASAKLVDVISAEVNLKWENGELAGLCPFHNEKSPSFYVVPNKSMFHCFGCGAHGSAIDFVMRRRNLSFTEAMRELLGLPAQAHPKQPNGHANGVTTSADRDLAMAAFEWGQGIDPRGTLAEAYLKARGVALPDWPEIGDSLRFSASCALRRDGKGHPALLAAWRDPSTGASTGGIHRIYLLDDGSWHLGPKSKLSLGPSRGVIMLGQPRATDGLIAIGEGIETVMAGCKLAGIESDPVTGLPAWAAPAGYLKTLARQIANSELLLESILGKLLILGDKGEAGEAGAMALYDATRAQGIEAELRFPVGDDDFADDLAQGREWSAAGSPGGLTPAGPARELETKPRLGSADILALAKSLTKDFDPKQVTELIRQTARGEFGGAAEGQILIALRKSTGLELVILKKLMREAKRGMGLKDKENTEKPEWTKNLPTNAEGEPIPITMNVLTALREDPSWFGILAFDEFHQRPMIMKQPPWDEDSAQIYPRSFNDADEARILVWVQQQGLHVRIDAVRQALAIVVDDNRYHPIRDYLNSLKWDGNKRLDGWLTYYLGVDDIENYTSPIGVCWIISAVARIFEPGCTAKYALILEGEQDLKKSTALEILGSPWFTDDVAEMGTKDAAMQVGNGWIVELSELDSTRKAHLSAIKAFISRKTDRFRKPFGRYVSEQPRQCVLAGTINPSMPYLLDTTGAVRFWPVLCKAIDADALRTDRDQLWAEAVARYRGGERWYLDNDDQLAAARNQQEIRTDYDTWEDHIARWLDEPINFITDRKITISRILDEALKLLIVDQNRGHQMRVATILKSLGYERSPNSGERPRTYLKISS